MYLPKILVAKENGCTLKRYKNTVVGIRQGSRFLQSLPHRRHLAQDSERDDTDLANEREADHDHREMLFLEESKFAKLDEILKLNQTNESHFVNLLLLNTKEFTLRVPKIGEIQNITEISTTYVRLEQQEPLTFRFDSTLCHSSKVTTNAISS